MFQDFNFKQLLITKKRCRNIEIFFTGKKMYPKYKKYSINFQNKVVPI